jgi:hypothetical protein
MAKAWVNLDGSSGTIRASYNISRVVRNGQGDYTVWFIRPFSNTRYIAIASCTGANFAGVGSMLTGENVAVGRRIVTRDSTGLPIDPGEVYAVFYGEQ